MSPEAFQYLSLLETEKGIRELLGRLTPEQERRLAMLREHALSLCSKDDKDQLHALTQNGGAGLSSRDMVMTGEARERHWAKKAWKPFAHNGGQIRE